MIVLRAFLVLAAALVLTLPAPAHDGLEVASPAPGASAPADDLAGIVASVPAEEDTTAHGHLRAPDCVNHAGCAPALVSAGCAIGGVRAWIASGHLSRDRPPADRNAGPAAPPPDFPRATA